MKYAELPFVGKPVSRLIFGTGNDSFRAGKDQKELLDEVFAAGITTIDTGRVYGKAEKVLGDWLDARGLYDQVVIISKGAHPSLPFWQKRVNEKEIRKDFEKSCEKLRTNYIDIYLLHRDDPDVEAGRIIELLNAMHAEGKIGAFGGSNWTHQRIEEANEYAYKHDMIPFAVSSPNFSLAHQIKDPWGGNCISITGPENADAREWYRKNQMPVIAYSSLANGLFSGKVSGNDPDALRRALSEEARKGYGYPENFEKVRRCEHLAEEKGCTVSQIALSWIFHQELNTFAVVTSSKKERIRQNTDALELVLTKEECEFLAGE